MADSPAPSSESGGVRAGAPGTPSSCPCLICHPDPTINGSAAVDAVGRHGWSSLVVARSLDVAYTVGVYHTFGEPELVMVGLSGEDMASWLNTAVELGRDNGSPAHQAPFD